MFRRSISVGLLVLGCSLLAQGALPAGKPYLGISLAAKIPPALAAQLKLDGGAMIIAVAENSPAAKAGIKVHDIIIKVSGKSIKSPADLKKVLSSHPENENLVLSLRRGTASLEFNVKPGAAPPKRRPPLESAPARPGKTSPADGAKAWLGVRLAGIPPSLASHLKLPANQGVLVEKTLPGSPAYDANLQEHDVILQVAGKAVTSSTKSGNKGINIPEEFRELQLRGLRGGITGGLRIESLESLFGNSRDAVSSNLHQLIAARRPGEEGELSIVRAGEKKKVKVTLAADPSARRSVFPPEALPRGNFGNSSVSSSVTVSDGDLTITVRENNGRKTFSVRRGREVIADKEPWEALDKMPADIQESVRRLKVRSSRGSGSGGSPLPPGEKKKAPREEKKKPI